MFSEGPLQLLLDRAQPGELVHIPAGTYHENIIISKSGTADKPIIFEGLDKVQIRKN